MRVILDRTLEMEPVGSRQTKARTWCGTWGRGRGLPVTEAMIDRIKALKCEAIVASLETGAGGFQHIQFAVHFKNPRARSGIKADLDQKVHLERMQGTWDQAADYCRPAGKDGKPKPGHIRLIKDEGEGPVNQGRRTDLEGLRDRVTGGDSIDHILACAEGSHLSGVMRYHKALTKLETAILRTKSRSWMTTAEWLWGPTGVGKSHRAFEGYSPETHYVWEPSDRGWWDGYRGQEVVIFNDFRGELKYNELLGLIDKWPKKVSRRGEEPIPFLAKHVIITSSLPPEKVYSNRVEEDSLDQLKRRCKVIEMQKQEIDDTSSDEEGEVFDDSPPTNKRPRLDAYDADDPDL